MPKGLPQTSLPGPHGPLRQVEVESIPTGSSPRWGASAVGPEKAWQLARDSRSLWTDDMRHSSRSAERSAAPPTALRRSVPVPHEGSTVRSCVLRLAHATGNPNPNPNPNPKRAAQVGVTPATFRVQPATPCIQPATPCIQPATRCIQPVTPCIQPATPSIQVRTEQGAWRLHAGCAYKRGEHPSNTHRRSSLRLRHTGLQALRRAGLQPPPSPHRVAGPPPPRVAAPRAHGCRRNEQLFVSYGERDNLRWLLHYGFALADNPEQRVAFDVIDLVRVAIAAVVSIATVSRSWP